MEEGTVDSIRKELCEQFQVSRPTVRAAIAYLANQGYLVTVKGKGTFVSKPKIVEDTTVFWRASARKWQQGYLCADGSIRTADDCGR